MQEPAVVIELTVVILPPALVVTFRTGLVVQPEPDHVIVPVWALP